MRRSFSAGQSITLVSMLVSGQVCAQTAPQAAPMAGGELDEIVVTAEKRGEESLLKVPVPVAVLNTDQLAGREQVKIQDFASEVPGLTVAPAAANQTNLSIRGINTGGQGGTPTVGVMIDDVPFGSSIESYLPELDPGDLARVEVLRGPQGTLYGSDSMGGLIRFVTVEPSTDAFRAQASVGTDSIHNGDGIGYSVRGSANLPVTDNLAIRASAFRRNDPGYIDYVLTGDKGANETSAVGGRLAAKWRPADGLSLTLSAISQTIDSEASGEVIPSLGELQSNYVRGASGSEITVRSFSAVLNAELAGFSLTSVTGYNTTAGTGNADFSFAYGQTFAHLLNISPHVVLIAPIHNGKFVQELRLAKELGEHADIQLGGFYTHENTTTGVTLAGIDPVTGTLTTPLNAVYNYAPPSTLAEYAAFADLTWRFTDSFDVQLGGRGSHIDQVFESFDKYGALNRPNPLPVARTETTATPFTYLVTPRFQATPDIMLYLRAASGYRPGGTNTAAGTPPQFAPDKTYTYEVGMKGAFLDKRLTTDLSLYYIDWKQIQIQLRTPQLLLYNGNGGTAKSEGAEFTATARPFERTSITGWVDYDDAVLTTSFGASSPTYGQPGDRLPNSPRISGDIAVRQEYPLFTGSTGFVALDASYTGDRVGIFQATALRQSYPGFAQTNFQAGLAYRAWTVTGYVNNLADIRGELNGGIGYANPQAFLYIQPRTVGLTITAKF